MKTTRLGEKINLTYKDNEYKRIHLYLNRHNPKKRLCNVCKSTAERSYQHALIHGKQHEQKIENYIEMCSKCHTAYDMGNYKIVDGQIVITKTKDYSKVGNVKNHCTAKPIDQYLTNGELVKSYESISMAAKDGFPLNGLSKCLKTGKEGYGFIWKYKTGIKKPKVLCIDVNGNEKIYDMASIAAKELNLGLSFLCKVIRGDYKKYKCYTFKYIKYEQ